ncbi:hypothetical protein PYCC9005_000057 [Savitreella phatthalungensis]
MASESISPESEMRSMTGITVARDSFKAGMRQSISRESNYMTRDQDSAALLKANKGDPSVGPTGSLSGNALEGSTLATQVVVRYRVYYGSDRLVGSFIVPFARGDAACAIDLSVRAKLETLYNEWRMTADNSQSPGSAIADCVICQLAAPTRFIVASTILSMINSSTIHARTLAFSICEAAHCKRSAQETLRCSWHTTEHYRRVIAQELWPVFSQENLKHKKAVVAPKDYPTGLAQLVELDMPAIERIVADENRNPAPPTDRNSDVITRDSHSSCGWLSDSTIVESIVELSNSKDRGREIGTTNVCPSTSPAVERVISACRPSTMSTVNSAAGRRRSLDDLLNEDDERRSLEWLARRADRARSVEIECPATATPTSATFTRVPKALMVASPITPSCQLVIRSNVDPVPDFLKDSRLTRDDFAALHRDIQRCGNATTSTTQQIDRTKKPQSPRTITKSRKSKSSGHESIMKREKEALKWSSYAAIGAFDDELIPATVLSKASYGKKKKGADGKHNGKQSMGESRASSSQHADSTQARRSEAAPGAHPYHKSHDKAPRISEISLQSSFHMRFDEDGDYTVEGNIETLTESGRRAARVAAAAALSAGSQKTADDKAISHDGATPVSRMRRHRFFGRSTTAVDTNSIEPRGSSTTRDAHPGNSILQQLSVSRGLPSTSRSASPVRTGASSSERSSPIVLATARPQPVATRGFESLNPPKTDCHQNALINGALNSKRIVD